MTDRDLTDKIPAEVLAELSAAAGTLETLGSVLEGAVRQLDRATTAAWTAVVKLEPTDEEWEAVERSTGMERGWAAAYRLRDRVDQPEEDLGTI